MPWVSEESRGQKVVVFYLVVGIGRRRRCIGEEGGVRGGGREEGGELEAEALHVQPPVLLHVLPLQLAPPAAAAVRVRVRLPRGAGGRAAPAALPPALHLVRPNRSALTAWLCRRAVQSRASCCLLALRQRQGCQDKTRRERGWTGPSCYGASLAAACLGSCWLLIYTGLSGYGMGQVVPSR